MNSFFKHVVVVIVMNVLLSQNAVFAERTVKGRILDPHGRAAAGFLVKAWDEDSGSSNDLLGTATTSSGGYYVIGPFEAKHWDPAPHNVTTWRPDIFIEVYAKISGKWVIVKKSGTLSDRQHKYNTNFDLKLPGISGTIRDSKGPVSGVLVRACDEDGLLTGNSDVLNETTTDSQGKYSMYYEGKHWDPEVPGSVTWRADIFLNALIRVEGDWVKVNRSRTYSDHPHASDLKVDLTIPENKWVGRSTAFKPEVHGWPFSNKSRKILPIGERWGLCGGMSLSALRRFRNGQPIGSSFTAEVQDELVKAQFSTLSLGVNEKFVEWQAKPTLPHANSPHTIGFSTKQEWPRIKKAIDRGAPIILGLIRIQSVNPGKVFDNHQVLAIGYKYNDGTKQVEIYLYDSNHPGLVSVIYLNIGIPRNQIKARQETVTGTRTNSKGQKEDIIVTEKVRGFFVIDKDSGPPKNAPTITPAPIRKEQPIRRTPTIRRSVRPGTIRRRRIE